MRCIVDHHPWLSRYDARLAGVDLRVFGTNHCGRDRDASWRPRFDRSVDGRIARRAWIDQHCDCDRHYASCTPGNSLVGQYFLESSLLSFSAMRFERNQIIKEDRLRETQGKAKEEGEKEAEDLEYPDTQTT